MMPPVPPNHFPPGHPGHPSNLNGPRIIQNQTPAPTNPMRLTDQMGRLSINSEDLHLDDSPTSHRYKGYTFFKAAVPGQKATWAHVERTKMNLSENDLIKMVQKKSKKTSASEQYRKLLRSRRDHVDQLIEEHKLRDPCAEWHCVYVKEVKKSATGKDARFGDYETASMDIVIKRKPTPSVHPRTSLVDLDSSVRNRGRSVKFDGPHPDHGIRPINRGMEGNAPFPRPNGPGQFHPPMHGQPQHPPPQLHQQHPPMVHPHPPMPQGPGMGGSPPMFQGPTQVHGPMPAQGPPMGGQPPMFQGQMPRPPMPPASHPQPGMHGPPHSGPGMNNGPGFEVLNAPRGPSGPGAHHPSPRPDQMRPPFAPNPDQFQTLHHPRPKANHGHLVKPKHYRHEHDWAHDGSSVEDDESMNEGYSSGTEDTDQEIHEAITGRGSLHRRDSKKQYRPEPVYRSHQRQQTTKYLDKKNSQKRYPSGYVVIPATSKGASKRPGKTPSKEMRLLRSRNSPKLSHETSIDEEELQDRLRDRTRNDMRTLLLDDREARLDHQQRMIEHQTRMLDGGLDRGLDGRFGERLDGRFGERLDGRLDGGLDGRLGGRFDGRLDGGLDDRFDEVRYHHRPRPRREPLYHRGSPYFH